MNLYILHVKELKNHDESFSKEGWRDGEYIIGLKARLPSLKLAIESNALQR